jgi:putative transposase
MTRRPRIVLPGWVHHVTQRGNHRQKVFYSDNDRLVYLQLLQEYFHKWGIQLIGHNLMDNHVHLAAIPEREDSLSNGIGQLHHDFALWQNIQRQTNGHLWQNRFFSTPVEEERAWDVLAYIELNPERARMVEHAWEWEWSSAQAHIAGFDPSGLLNMDFWRKQFNPEEWQKFLERIKGDETTAKNIRYATMRGLFLGKKETALRLERELGKQLLPRKHGRKPKQGWTLV